jgi:hypothetical protein
MRTRSFALTLSLVISSALCLPSLAAAQLISLKTIPVAAGDQFLIFPSRNLGMGAPSIALDDQMLDPFVNPAKGSRLGESLFLAAPVFYSTGQNSGNAKTIPVGALFKESSWFGGGVVALQQLKEGTDFFGIRPFIDVVVLPPNALSELSATNKYATAVLGRQLPGGFAVGGSVMLAELNAVDGVEHLYAMSAGIDQDGDVQDFRFGVTGTLPGDRTVELVVLHNRFNMTHDVTYVDWVLVDSTNWIWEQQVRLETNLDRTRTWGLHLGYVQPLGSNGWRIGGALTGNRKNHPKIPNYELVNIPRDPGHSWAYNIGLGLSKTSPATTFALDVIYEPAWSDTWAEADTAVTTASGGTIPAGGKTIENTFKFSDVIARMGVEHRVGPAAFQLGLQLWAVDYDLDQFDNVADTFRRQGEHWMEWTPSWGARVRLSDIELRYLGRVTTGTGRPGVAWLGGVAERAMDAGLANDIVVAPSGPLTLQDTEVWTHQISISLPIR